MAAVKFHRNFMGGLELGQLFRTRLRSVRYLTADIFGAAEAAADMKNCGECDGPVGIIFLAALRLALFATSATPTSARCTCIYVRSAENVHEISSPLWKS